MDQILSLKCSFSLAVYVCVLPGYKAWTKSTPLGRRIYRRELHRLGPFLVPVVGRVPDLLPHLQTHFAGQRRLTRNSRED